MRQRTATPGAWFRVVCGLFSAIAVCPACCLGQTQATALPLLYPWAIAYDAAGDLYFAETASHVVRKVTPGGVLTTVAGTGTQGFSGDGGPAIAAQLDSPSGLAVDAAGDVYVADTHNHRVRRVDAGTGVITTVAGTGTPGFSGDNGPAAAAQMDLPTALAVDGAGDLYLADTRNHRIRRVDGASGAISTVAGNGTQGSSGDGGPAIAAQLDSPAGLSVDGAGNVYLADTHNHRIRRVDAASGVISTVAGSSTGAGLPGFSGDNGPAALATLALPRGLALDSGGNLYVADSANHRIRRIDAAGAMMSTAAGQGTEAFAGDGAPAVSASLDAPRSVAISPAGLLTLADTGNARIRQLDNLPAPGPDIHTIAGLGVTNSSETLALSGPSVTAYGSGVLTATIASPTAASGPVTFLDTTTSTAVTLGTVALTAGVATFSTAALPAGPHAILATYAGDTGHAPAESSAFALTVTPLAATAVPNAASVLYGQAIPMLSGTVTGILPQDATLVSAVFTTSAAALSPSGVYSISAVLTGPSAMDYTLTTAPASLTIAPAPTLTMVSPSTANPAMGQPVTVALQAVSTTSGTPTGSVSLYDGNALLATLPLGNGAAAFATSALSVGGHALAATYSGDNNFLASSSAVANVTVGPAADFTLTVTGATSQSVPSGSPATYSFAVAAQGAPLTSPIALAVQGLPPGATASMNPAYVPPGATPAAFTLTIQTAKLARDVPPRPFAPAGPLAALVLPGFAAFARGRGGAAGRYTGVRRKLFRASTAACCILWATLLGGCGNRVNPAPELATATAYTVTVTATATSPAGAALQHSVDVTLQVL